MKRPKYLIVAGMVCAVAVVIVVANTEFGKRDPLKNAASKTVVEQERMAPLTGLIHEGKVYLDKSQLADAGIALANRYTGDIQNPDSLDDLRKALEKRGNAGLSELQTDLATIEKSGHPQDLGIARLYFQIGLMLTYEGRLDEAVKAIDKAMLIGQKSGMPLPVLANLKAINGVLAFRRGEVDNCIGCVGPSSCILPISSAAVHKKQTGSRQAVETFTEYLKVAPGDLRVRWMLNLAYMTLGEYPAKVPPEYLVPLDRLSSAADVGRFHNVAPEVGLTSRGPNQAGGSVFDDFTGDGLPDLFVTSLDLDRGASFFVNDGHGKLKDQSDEAGLADQIYALNVIRADYNNDGHPDVLLLRGGWEQPMRLSLLKNLGNGKFEDATIASGLNAPISSETAAWGDYDNDGLVDLYVGGEYLPAFPTGENPRPEVRNRCRLYHNEGHGTFVDVAAKLGVENEQCTKGVAWGDYDGDGRLDLFVSNMNAPSRLYHQEQDGTFRDVAPELGITGPAHGFACWFWDYDNDGRLDIYVNDYTSTLAEFVADSLHIPQEHPSRPCLYRNLGKDGFRDVTADVGLDQAMMPMGCNFGDVDNDGFLDVYMGTGRMALEVLVPNLMFKNDGGRKFLDITKSSGTGHLQKGHGISFADWNCDGNLDLFVEAGGAVPGDRAYNLLFMNPGQGNHWLKVKLTGTKTNRAALGAHIKATISAPDGTERTIHRTIGNNASFGGNSLVESLGLRDATSVKELQVTWPTSGTTQTFRDIECDQAIEITEGTDEFAALPQKQVLIPTDL
ncbi:MAG: CRTAC1 family protein [Planctomycetes bacterium]|nr:CRTAC1 family protein [Planctomycetota bacterium]